MPIYEGAVRVILPRPYVQCVKRIQPEAIGALKIVKKLPAQLWWPWFMCLIVVPLLGVHQKVGARQFEASVRSWFVENDLRFGGVNDAPAYQIHVNEMEPHGPLIRSAHATEN